MAALTPGPPIPTPSGQKYLIYCYPGDDNTQAPLYWQPASAATPSLTMTSSQSAADQLLVTTVGGDSTVRYLSFDTSYNWTGGDDNPPNYGVTIQSQSGKSGENYLYVPDGSASSSKPQWQEQTSDKYKTTWYLEPLEVSVQDDTPVCWRDGFRLKYMWDSTDVNNSWYLIHCVNVGTFTGFKSGGAPPSTSDALAFLNTVKGGITSTQVSTVFYLPPVSFAFKACSGVNQGVCSLEDSFAFDPFNSDGLWTYGPYNSSGCVFTHNSGVVVTDGSVSALPSCSFCPINPQPPPPGSQPPGSQPPGSQPPGSQPPGSQSPSSAPAPATLPDEILSDWQTLWAKQWFRISLYLLGAVLLVLLLWRLFGNRQQTSTTNAPPPSS